LYFDEQVTKMTALDTLTILSIFGTRPEAIKMAPVVQQLSQHPQYMRSVVCVTAQHRQMLDQVLDLFSIYPDFDLNLMRPNQSLSQITAAVIQELDPIIQKVQPDWVLVQGDTTTVMAASLVAFYHRVKVGHVEAGLRTHDKYRPFPEEINRRLTDVVADLFFAPTAWARQNLLNEGISDTVIRVTGNTVIDALLQVAAQNYDWSGGPLADIPRHKRLVLITAHRRESFGEPFRNLCLAIRDLAQRYRQACHFVYPVHLNPNVRAPVYEILGQQENISLIEPLDYLPLVQLMKQCTLVLTDSGGIQEEAPSLGVPVLVLRETTERPEALAAGTARLVGTQRERIVAEASHLLDDMNAHTQMAKAVNPYGDGQAARRIVAALLHWPHG
jgi:UDP-N-acetylglucosamine 2-epimerase (non-hydrolysing)